jgi:hypothetical protein
MPRNFDYPMPQEGRMARQQLARIAMDASKLHNTLQDDDDLPAWVLLKINTAEDRLHMASDYMRYKVAPGLNAYQGFGNVVSYGADEDTSADGKKDSLVRIGVSAGVGTAVGAAWAAYSKKDVKKAAMYGALAGAAVGVARNLAMGQPALGFGAAPESPLFDEEAEDAPELIEAREKVYRTAGLLLIPLGGLAGYLYAITRRMDSDASHAVALLGAGYGVAGFLSAEIYVRYQRLLTLSRNADK